MPSLRGILPLHAQTCLHQTCFCAKHALLRVKQHVLAVPHFFLQSEQIFKSRAFMKQKLLLHETKALNA